SSVFFPYTTLFRSFAFSGAFVMLGVSLAFVEFALPMSSRMAHVLAATGVLSLAAVPVATGVSILRYRLYDIDVVINRTLVYGSVTAMLGGGFALLRIISAPVVLVVCGQAGR